MKQYHNMLTPIFWEPENIIYHHDHLTDCAYQIQWGHNMIYLVSEETSYNYQDYNLLSDK